MSAQVIQRDQLGELTKIGQGGQGVVYAAPKVTTKFAAAMVYKEYKAAALAGIDFTALATMPALVEDSLAYAQAERLISIAAWPCALVDDDGGATGFVMPAIPEDFFIPLATVKGISTITAEFQHLLNHQIVLDARGIDIDDAQRYSLLREVASGLAFLHTHGVCVGDVSPKNLLFRLTPHEGVYFIDCDAMRVNDVSALSQVETPGWGVPSGEELATIYSDTYKLGLLALRLLAGDQDTTNTGHLPPSTPDLLRQIITDTLTNEAERRPLPQAWTFVLGHAIEEAQHRHSTAAPDPPNAGAEIAHSPVVRTRPQPPRAAAPSPSAISRSPGGIAGSAAPNRPHNSRSGVNGQQSPNPAHRGAVKISSWIRIGSRVKIRAPGDDHDGHVGEVLEIFSDEPGIIVQFTGDADPYAFQRSEIVPITPPKKRETDRPYSPSSLVRQVTNALKPGHTVKIRAPGDDHDGHVGEVLEIFSDEPGIIVQFTGDADPYAFQRSEIVPITPPKK
jgi:serine/threonine protein kinase